MPEYIVGSRAPSVSVDPGSGQWCSAAYQSAAVGALKHALQLAMRTETIEVMVGPDAIAHMRHYLGNTGEDRLVDMASLMRRTVGLQYAFKDELKRAKDFVETLGPGKHSITSAKIGSTSFAETDVYGYYAVGGYRFWGQGEASVERLSTASRYTLDFRFYLFDRYNWDNKKVAKFGIAKVPDKVLQELHRQCYAREFNIMGIVKMRVEWEHAIAAEPAHRNNPFGILQQVP